MPKSFAKAMAQWDLPLPAGPLIVMTVCLSNESREKADEEGGVGEDTEGLFMVGPSADIFLLIYGDLQKRLFIGVADIASAEASVMGGIGRLNPIPMEGRRASGSAGISRRCI